MVSLRAHLAGLSAGLLAVLGALTPCQADGSGGWVQGWLDAQAHIQTWSADVLQTRVFKSLKQPLTATGRVWFAAPDRFRWELGNPAQTIALRLPEEMLVVYPRLKRVEEYPLDAARPGPWGDTLALLDAGFPRSRAGLESRFKLVSERTVGDQHQIELQPRSASARRLMPRLKVAFATNDFSLRLTEIEFADGSILKNEFTNSVLNPRIEDSVFTPPENPDYEVVRPLEGR